MKPADFPPKVIQCSAWLRRLQAIPHRTTVNIDESLAKGFDRPWTTWRCLRLRTGFTCSKEQRQRWRYYEGDTTCECGLATENTAHMMQCTLLAQPCSLDDLNKFQRYSTEMRGKMENTSLMTRRGRRHTGHVVGVYPLPCPLLVVVVQCSSLLSTSQLLRLSGKQCSHSGGVCPQIQG